uniref:OCIA domain containing 2 n=1 Tax=Sus scrofa TaxID=9823 RepID=A0A8D1L8G3_PIG
MAAVSTDGNQDKAPHLPPLSKQSLLFCPKSKLHIHRAEISKIIRECQEESFWKRALPFSLVSMLITQGLVHQGYLAANPRFGSLPKVALAGILGFGLGKASYIRVCQSKFHSFEESPLGNALKAGLQKRSSNTGHSAQRSTYEVKVSSHDSFVTAPAA